MEPYGEARTGTAHDDLGWRYIGRTITALVLAMVTIGLVVVVASLSWWEVSSTAWGTFGYPLGNPFCQEVACGDYTDANGFRDVFPTTFGLVLTALALSVIELGFLVGCIFCYWNRVGILVTGILGSMALLAAPIYLYFGLPRALSSSGRFYNSFFGSYTERGITYAWGGGLGWFMAFFVVGFFLVSTIVAFFAARQMEAPGSV